jgi:Flp pilus assembly protein TadD
VLYERRGDHRRARTLLDQALALDADDVVALTARGTIEMAVGAAVSARRYLQRAHTIGNTAFTAANLGGALVALGEFDRARALLEPFAEAAPPPELLANLAYAQLAVGHVEHARGSLQRAYAAGVDARNPRIVALERLITDGEVQGRKKALAAAEAAR